jgi:hypothetical protein
VRVCECVRLCSGSRIYKSGEATWKASWKRLAATGKLRSSRGEGMQAEERPRCPCLRLCLWPPLSSLPPPQSSLRLPVASSSAALGSAPLCSVLLQEGYLLPGLFLLPLLLLLSPLTDLASRGWGPQGWTHPIVALSSAGRTDAQLDAGPQSPEVGSVPGSLAASSRSVPAGDAAILGPLKLGVGGASHPRLLIPDHRPQGGLYSRYT